MANLITTNDNTNDSNDNDNKSDNNNNRKVWFITGCSSGLGRALAIEALSRGDKVVATARNADTLADLKQRGAYAVALDVTAPDAVMEKTVADAVAALGRIDILVNNAGYSLVGGVDECSTEEVFDIYNTNVFGVLKTVRAVLPVMRAQQSGVIANVSSSLCRRSFPAVGVYASTKFAVAGLTESLRAEVASLGIDVTSIDLGMFRTPFGSNGVFAKNTVNGSNPVVEATKQHLGSSVGKQPGDPAKGAKVIADALTKSGRCADKAALPVHLAVGSDTVPFITAALEHDLSELREWAELVSGTDHDDIVAAA